MRKMGDLIFLLGGPKAVAGSLSELINEEIRPGRVSTWKYRDWCPWAFRGDMRQLAERGGLNPDDFPALSTTNRK